VSFLVSRLVFRVRSVVGGGGWGVRVCFVVGVWCVFACFGCAAAFGALNVAEPFEIIPGSFRQLVSTVQAGAHEDFTTRLDFAHDAQGHTHNDVREVVVNLPAGFSGNNNAVPTCTFGQLLAAGERTGNNCPPASQVGMISFEANLGRGLEKLIGPVYNMETSSFGVTAELGLKVFTLTAVLLASVRPEDSALTVTSPDIERIGEAHNFSLTTWGVPAAEGPASMGGHTEERGLQCSALPPTALPLVCEFGGEKANFPVRPFLANPTSCGQVGSSVSASSWEEPEKSSRATAEFELVGPGLAVGEVGPILGPRPISGCERVPFDPSMEASPTTSSVESPSGLDVSVTVPQRWSEPLSVATSHLKDTTFALPVGFTINPSAGSGLGACTPQEYASETFSSLPGEGCPPESKIGSVEVETPVLSEKITGAVYVAQPFNNPFSEPGHPNGSLTALYIVAKLPDRGIIVKVAGQIHLDPITGQLVTTFLNTPQQPFNHFILKFRPGATAPLVSPPVCGTYSARASFAPWSAPEEPRVLSSPPFPISSGIGGGACPSGGVPPFTPRAITGSQNNNAGSYSPFYLRILREDGEQEITKFTSILPPGLTGNLTGIPFCPDAQIEAAKQATGRQEIDHPSCPAASEIGHTLVGAGVGSILAWTPGKVYLAGPYHGSALSIVSVTSAVVGPFDIGTVVIRFALRINPITAQVEVDSAGSDQIPHIIDGIVVHVRDIHVYIDRPKFILNPTSCAGMLIMNTVTGAGGDFTNPASQIPVNVSTPFQAADCANLTFKPIFKVSTSGRTSRTKGASLNVTLVYPKAPQGSQANIHSVKVNLPRQLPSRLTTLQKACPDKTFEANPAACSTASRVGHATAITPILPVPLTGPAYFVSHGGAKFPELIIVLQGYGITIDLHGETFINKHGITSSTFRTVPDQPVTSFQLSLPQGPNSALAANGNLCNTKLTIPTTFTAQNGQTTHQNTHITTTQCLKQHHNKQTHKTHTKH